MQVFTRERGVDVSFRDVTIKIPERGCHEGGEWRHAPEAWAEIWEKSVELSWVLPRKKKVDFRLLAVVLWRVRTWFGADRQVSIERWCRSPYVKKPLNSKVIKRFVPELRSRKCFLCFGIPMLSIYELWTFYVRFTYSWMGMLHICDLEDNSFLVIPFFSKSLFVCTRLNGFKYCYSILTILFYLSYLPTPPLGQDMTQGQFLSGV